MILMRFDCARPVQAVGAGFKLAFGPANEQGRPASSNRIPGPVGQRPPDDTTSAAGRSARLGNVFRGVADGCGQVASPFHQVWLA